MTSRRREGLDELVRRTREPREGASTASRSDAAASHASAGAFIETPRSPLLPSSRRCSAHPPIAIDRMRMTSVVGWRMRPDGRTWHAGLDLQGGVGTPVHAVRDGVCVLSVADNTPGFGGYGMSVVLFHEEDGLCSQYAHLSRRHVEVGARVRHGDVIAEVGRTSSGTWPNMGAHLHFELRRQIPPELRQRLRARTLRHDGRTLLEGSPYPGSYTHPTRDVERFAAVWVNPLVYLAELGIQGPPLPWGEPAVPFTIVRGSAADCGEHDQVAARDRGGSAADDLAAALSRASAPRGERDIALDDVEPAASAFDGLPFDSSPEPHGLDARPPDASRPVGRGGLANAGPAIAVGALVTIAAIAAARGTGG